MSRWWLLLIGLAIWSSTRMIAQDRESSGETLHVTTQLVVLDATVLDKSGRIVTRRLGKGDFLIREDKKPQAIYSFESAQEHAMAAAVGDKDKSPLLIFVLDEMNYAVQPGLGSSGNTIEQLEQYAYLRNELMRFLRDQPMTLHQQTEVLVLKEHGFQVLVQPTRDRDMVEIQIAKHDPGLGQPYRLYLEETNGDRTLTKSSMQALWSMGLQERSVPGRKLVVWLGYGGPNMMSSGPVDSRNLQPFQRYTREITDLLVDARITLDVIGPGGGGAAQTPTSVAEQMVNYGYENNFGFAGYISTTGGQWKNGNDVRGEISASVNYGTAYYTLCYQPDMHDFDGEFRRIRVTVKDHPEWTVLTKAGYYAMRFGGDKDFEHQLQTDLSVAMFDSMPFSAIVATLIKVERINGTDAARFTFQLASEDLQWQTQSTAGVSVANITVSGAALGSVFAENTLSSQISTWKLKAPLGANKGDLRSTVTVTVHVPPKTKRLRFVVRDLTNGRMGTVDLNPQIAASAPEIDAPKPALEPRLGAK